MYCFFFRQFSTKPGTIVLQSFRPTPQAVPSVVNIDGLTFRRQSVDRRSDNRVNT